MTASPVVRVDGQLHRALSSPVRRRIVELLTDDSADAQTLARRLDLHVNTVRTHLGVLIEAGLVTADPEVRDHPGRPRLLYRATDEATHGGERADSYRFLAEILASQLASMTDDPAELAERAGVAWGQFLVAAPSPTSPLDPQAAIAQIVELLDEFGFLPELDDSDELAPQLLLHRCPFLQVAKNHDTIVCSIHRGILRGALERMGGAVEVQGLLPFVEPGLCVAQLEVAA